MRTSARLALLAGGFGVLLGAAGFGLLASGRKANRVPSETADADKAEPRMAASPLLEAAAIRVAVREEVRAAVQDEAAAVRQQQASSQAGRKPDDTEAAEPPAPTPSYEKARTHVADRVTQGSWSEKDRENIGSLLSSMSDAERAEIMKQLIVAVNKDQIKVTLEGPLF